MEKPIDGGEEEDGREEERSEGEGEIDGESDVGMGHLIRCEEGEICVNHENRREAAWLQGMQRGDDGEQEGEDAAGHVGIDSQQEVSVFQFHHHVYGDGGTKNAQRK